MAGKNANRDNMGEKNERNSVWDPVGYHKWRSNLSPARYGSNKKEVCGLDQTP